MVEMSDKQKIIDLRGQGMSYGSLSKLFQLSRARIHQICTGYKSPGFNSAVKRAHDNILVRDGFVCQWGECCKNKNISIKDLVVHCIDFDNNNNSPDNMITLCRFCHSSFHSKNHIDQKFLKNLAINHEHSVKKRICLQCGKEFILPTHNIRKTCSEECFKKLIYKGRTKMSAEERKAKHKMQMADYFQKVKLDPIRYQQLKQNQQKYAKKYYIKNKEKIAVRNKKHVLKNIEKYRKYWREYAKKRMSKAKVSEE
jgi:DNA-directed RNA polymerase subunit RPC12/RpoP